jgi:hypothetical protein
MIATRSKVKKKDKEGKESLFHTLGAVAGDRRLGNSLREENGTDG